MHSIRKSKLITINSLSIPCYQYFKSKIDVEKTYLMLNEHDFAVWNVFCIFPTNISIKGSFFFAEIQSFRYDNITRKRAKCV